MVTEPHLRGRDSTAVRCKTQVTPARFAPAYASPRKAAEGCSHGSHGSHGFHGSHGSHSCQKWVSPWDPGTRYATPGSKLAQRCKPGRWVQTWQMGANLAEGCKSGRWVQSVQKVGIPPAPLHLLHPYVAR